MADTSRPLGSSSPEYPHKPSDLFGGKQLGSTQNQMGTFSGTPVTPSKKNLLREGGLHARSSGPRIGKEISNKTLTPEQQADKEERKMKQEELSNRFLEGRVRGERLLKQLKTSGLGDSYKDLSLVEKTFSDKIKLIELLLIKNSIAEDGKNTLDETQNEIASLEDTIRELERSIDFEIKNILQKSIQKTAQETEIVGQVESLRKELEAKNKVNELLAKAMPLYGKFETLTQKVEALNQGKETEALAKEIKTVSALFDTFKLNPTEEVFEALTTFVNEKENQITSLFLDELQQKEKNKAVEAPMKTSENTAPQMKKIDQVPAESKPGEAVEKPAEETLSGKQTVMRPAVKKTTILLRQKKGENKSIEERTVPVEEWVKDVRSKEALKKETPDIIETRKVYRAKGGQMLAIHKKMFLSNPEKYMEVYGNKKSWTEGDLNKAAFLHAPKDALDDLAQERSMILHDIAEMEAKIMSNGSDEEDRLLAPKIAELKNREVSIAQKMQRYSNLTLQEKTKEDGKVPTFSSIEQYKEVYRPNAISEKPAPNKPMKRFVNFLMGKDGKRIKEKLPHTEGMVRLNEIEKAEKTPEGIRAQSHAIENNPKETVTHKEAVRIEPVLKQEATPEAVVAQEPVLTPFTNAEKPVVKENQQEKERKNRSVADLFRKITAGKPLRSIIFAFALGGGASAGLANKTEEVRTIQTLEQGISWKDYLSYEDRNFLNDFVGSKDSGFEKIMEMYIPSLPLDKANPSKLATLSDAECLKLLNFPGTVYGYGEDQRKEICFVIRRLENIIKARDIKIKMKPELSNSPYVYSNELMTLRGLFEEARRAAEQAINDEISVTRKI